MDDELDVLLLQSARSRLLEEYPRQVALCLDALTDDDVWRRPNEQANAIANLLLHLTGSNTYYMGHVLGGAPDHRNRDAEFAARDGRSRIELQRAWEESIGLAGRVLTDMTPARLKEPTGRAAPMSTVAGVLLHVTHHNAAHVGQIVWATKMLKPGAMDGLKEKARPADRPV